MGCLDFAPWGGKVMCSLAGVLMGTAVGGYKVCYYQ